MDEPEQLPEETSEGDRHIQCQQCGDSFLFSEREQKFFTEMGFVPPRYCPACRKARKQEPPKPVEWKETYEVECDRCGKTTTVPFKPVNGRPVYCRNCLNEVRGENGDSRNRYQETQTANKARHYSKDHDEVHGVGLSRIDDAERPYEELDRDVEILLDRLLGGEDSE